MSRLPSLGTYALVGAIVALSLLRYFKYIDGPTYDLIVASLTGGTIASLRRGQVEQNHVINAVDEKIQP